MEAATAVVGTESKNKLPIHPEELESPEEKKVRYRSIRIGQVALLIFAIGFSIVLTGVYPYMTQVSIHRHQIFLGGSSEIFLRAYGVFRLPRAIFRCGGTEYC